MSDCGQNSDELSKSASLHIQLRLDRRDRELDAARRISEALFQRLRLEDVLEQALRIALDVVEAEAGCILFANPEAQELEFIHAIGEKSPPIGTTFSWDEGIAGVAFQRAEAIVVDDVQQDQRHFMRIDQTFGQVTQDLIALPLKRWEGPPIGVLEVMNKQVGRLDRDDVAILTIISAFTAISIEEARLFEQVKLSEVAHVLGDISHDIKNMMMPITYGAWILEKKLDDLLSHVAPHEVEHVKVSQESSEKVLSMIKSNARLIQDRVKEIADTVKGLSCPPQFNTCRILDIVTTVLETLRPLAEDRGILIQQENLSTLPVIQADERRLFNAFYNLINNALDEVPEGGAITIAGSCESDAQTLCLSVADTGPGMSPEVRESLFTNRTISRKVGGTGLGTKIIKDVVDAHGGQIRVDSHIGLGTTFYIRLPLIQPTTRPR
ncbi:sensor histidine kinase [Nitrospira sp. M1]